MYYLCIHSGNHEYYTGDVDGWLKELYYLGVVPLHNSHVTIKHPRKSTAMLCLAGVDDVEGSFLRFSITLVQNGNLTLIRVYPINGGGQIYPTLTAISPTPTLHLARFKASSFSKTNTLTLLLHLHLLCLLWSSSFPLALHFKLQLEDSLDECLQGFFVSIHSVVCLLVLEYYFDLHKYCTY